MYIADWGNNRIRKIENGLVITVAGGGPLIAESGNATAIRLSAPESIDVKDGLLVITDTNANLVRSVKDGQMRTILGTRQPNLTGFPPVGDALSTNITRPNSIAIGDGVLYVGLRLNRAILTMAIEVDGAPTATSTSVPTDTAVATSPILPRRLQEYRP